MKFSEFESLMESQGVNTLADIARALESTPQAVSNWKARDQVPYHIVAKINNSTNTAKLQPQVLNNPISVNFESDKTTLSSIIVTLAEEFKVIVLSIFTAVFLTFTFVKFIQEPKFLSTATILLPESKSASLGGLAGLASQFGVNVPSAAQADLSSPSLLPELIKSRTFLSKIINRKFYIEQYKKELTLLAILTHGDNPTFESREILITKAMGTLSSMIQFTRGSPGSFSTIRVTTGSPLFSQSLAEVVLEEIESLNKDLKTRSVNEKTTFIENRIINVENQLDASEKTLKLFREQNRQISSPSLMLFEEQFNRDVEIQKGIYLTLKQQLELAKIEEVQTSFMQILDRPQMPLWPSNKNLRLSIILSAFFGLGAGIFIGFSRAFIRTPDIAERKKIRRGKYFLKKKFRDLIDDYRVSGVVGALFLSCAPFFLGHTSKNAIFFNLYSTKALVINILYISIMLITTFLFISGIRKKK